MSVRPGTFSSIFVPSAHGFEDIISASPHLLSTRLFYAHHRLRLIMTDVLPSNSSLYNITSSSNNALDSKDVMQPMVPTLPLDVDPTKQQLAYGKRAVPKLVKRAVNGGRGY